MTNITQSLTKHKKIEHDVVGENLTHLLADKSVKSPFDNNTKWCGK